MANDEQDRPISVAEDLTFQARYWCFQRFGWAAMVILVGLSILGIFGNGPISHRTSATEKKTLQLEHEGLWRRGTATVLKVRAASSGEQTSLWLGNELLEDVVLESVTPEPESWVAGDEWTEFRFRNSADGGLNRIYIQIVPQGVGLLRGTLRAGGESLNFSTFIYP